MSAPKRGAPTKAATTAQKKAAGTTGATTTAPLGDSTTKKAASSCRQAVASCPELPSHARWLPPHLVAAAFEVFSHYASSSQTTTSTTTAASPVPGRGASSAAEVSLAQLQLMFDDLGIAASESDLRDLVLQISQPQSTTSLDSLTLSFPLFLHVLTSPLESSSSSSDGGKGGGPRASAKKGGGGASSSSSLLAGGSTALVASDYQHIWRLLDRDRDGAIGAKDIQYAYQRYAAEGALQHPSPEYVAALLLELDEGNDGRVSYSDFVSVLTTH